MPMPDLNTLRQYMDFYQSQFPSRSIPGWNSGMDAHNARGAALSWAERMMGGQDGSQERMPDYFNNSGEPGQPRPNGGSYTPTPYREPTQFQPQRNVPPSGEIPYLARQAGFPLSDGGPGEPQDGAAWQQLARQQRPAPPVQNFLAQLLRGR